MGHRTYTKLKYKGPTIQMFQGIRDRIREPETVAWIKKHMKQL